MLNMSNICRFCNKKFSTKSNLTNHQKTTKRCLVLQGKQNKGYVCELCDKEFTINQTLQEHKMNCIKNNLKFRNRLINQDEKYTEDIKELNEKIKEKDDLLISQQYQLKQKDVYIAELRLMLDKANLTIADIAKQPKHDNRISQQINNNFDINDITKISKVLDKHLTTDVLRRGQEGVAEMLKEHLLKNESGDPIYECTDVARQKFEFVNSDGNIETDPKATKLIRNLGRSGMWNKAHSTGKKLWEKEDGSVNAEAQYTFMPRVSEVLEIDKDSTKLRSKLATITAKQKKISSRIRK